MSFFADLHGMALFESAPALLQRLEKPENKVIAHAVGVIFIFACMWGASYYNTRRLIAADKYVTDSMEFFAHLEGIRSASANAEQAEHGFLLTGEESFLEGSQTETAAVQQHVRRLRILAGDDLEQKVRIALVARALDRQKEEIAYVVTVRKNRGEAAAQQILSTADDAMDEIGRLTTELEVRQSAILQSRTLEAHRRAKSALLGVGALMVVFVILMLVRLRLTILEIREKQKVEADLRDAQTKLRIALDLEREQARMDSLTQVVNRRAFYELAGAEAARSRRYHRPLTIAYIDIDDFKKINDFQGHSVGDALLIAVAATLKSSVRASDVVARIGGDEFAILLPETDEAAAESVLEKLHERLLETVKRNNWSVSFSIGAASYQDPPESVDTMVRSADEAMYAIKNSGKGRIFVAARG